MSHDNMMDKETMEALTIFVGQTYSDICKYDQSLISTNQHLDSRKEKFKAIAESVLTPAIPKQSPVQQPALQYHQPPQQMAYIDRGISPLPPAPNDPNQMEFDFNNSKISLNLEKKIDDLCGKINNIDKKLSQLLEYIQYEAEDTES